MQFLHPGHAEEARQGTWRLASLVVVIAALSNLGQYYVSGPNFFGISGVVYGLFGYIWMKGKFDPASGLFVNGDKDTVTQPEAVGTLVSKLKTQKGIVIEHKVIAGANHFFDGKIDTLMQAVSAYLDKRLKTERKPSAA